MPPKKGAKQTGPKRLAIRYAKPEEIEEAWNLERLNLVENWDLHPATPGPLTPAAFKRRHTEGVRKWYDDELHKLLVAVQDDCIIGVAWFGLQNDSVFDFKVGFLFSIVVHPDYRRSGVGVKLIQEFKRRCHRAGAKYVRLAVLHQNVRAINLYRSLGFFDETHYMLARLEPTGPEKRKKEAAERQKKKNQG